MKKAVTLGIALIASTSLLAACGNSKSSSSDSSSTVKKTATPKYYYKNGTVKIHDLKVKITKTQVIQVGDKGNEYGEKPVLAIWYDTTNYTDKEIDPTSAWMAVATKVVQDNNKNSENTLEVGSLPDDAFLDSQTENIKKNGTVSNAVAYELDDTTTPVKITFSQGMDGKTLGTQTYNIK